jgi:hypothetical protein
VTCAQGATLAQAKAALKQYRDVMEAAEAIFEGKFDNVKDEDGDVDMAATKPSRPAAKQTKPSVSAYDGFSLSRY